MAPARAAPGSALRGLRVKLKHWDGGDRNTRIKMLEDFILRHALEHGPQLERYYGNGASLLLTRISAWLRLTYVQGFALEQQLKAVSIFLTAANGTRYLAEFVEFGGLLTILDLLSLREVPEHSKYTALQLLNVVANAGRFYKELICSFNGVQVIIDVLERANFTDTQTLAYEMCLVLGSGNPKYTHKVQVEIANVLSSRNITALRLGLQASRRLVEHTPPVPSARAPLRSQGRAALSNLEDLVAKATHLLASNDFEVQYEASELLVALATLHGEALGARIAGGMCDAMLQGAGDGSGGGSVPGTPRRASVRPGDRDGDKGPTPGHLAQAAAAKVLTSTLTTTWQSGGVRDCVLTERFVRAVLVTLSNAKHYESRKHAAELVDVLTSLATEEVFTLITQLTSDDFLHFLVNNPHEELEPNQVDMLQALAVA